MRVLGDTAIKPLLGRSRMRGALTTASMTLEILPLELGALDPVSAPAPRAAAKEPLPTISRRYTLPNPTP